MKSKNFITSFGYLSMDSKFLDTTTQRTVYIGGYSFNVDILRETITYRDNPGIYRWKPSDFKKAII